jgi:CubicO group peptidase (beta-lactamase class C family)
MTLKNLLLILLLAAGGVVGQELTPVPTNTSMRIHTDPQLPYPPQEDLTSPDLAAAIPIDDFIIQTMHDYHVAGVSACAFKDGEIIWTGAYGFANIAANCPVTTQTTFMLASISKTLTATGLLQLWEAGQLDLDGNILDASPFYFTNPNWPLTPITFRQLLTHTSSLDDNWTVMFSTYCQGDSPWQLPDYTYNYFVPGGTFYDPVANFETWPPGGRWEYCNHNFVLAGFLVGEIAGIPFAQYCRDSIFLPLEMTETSWFVADLDTLQMAMPYTYNGIYLELGHFSYADYPAGALRTSASQLAHHLIAISQYGRYKDRRILDSATVSAAVTLQCPGLSSIQGLTWHRSTVAGHTVWGHGGGDQGVSTYACVDMDDHFGVVVLTNGETFVATNAITARLFTLLTDSDKDSVPDPLDNCTTTPNQDQIDSDSDGRGDVCDNCLNADNAGQGDVDQDGVGDACDNCVDVANPDQTDLNGNSIGDACESCCLGRVGDVDGQDEYPDEITLGDIMLLVDVKFISTDCSKLPCVREADVNQDGGADPNCDDHLTLGDIMVLVDFLFITGPENATLPECL